MRDPHRNYLLRLREIAEAVASGESELLASLLADEKLRISRLELQDLSYADLMAYIEDVEDLRRLQSSLSQRQRTWGEYLANLAIGVFGAGVITLPLDNGVSLGFSALAGVAIVFMGWSTKQVQREGEAGVAHVPDLAEFANAGRAECTRRHTEGWGEDDRLREVSDRTARNEKRARAEKLLLDEAEGKEEREAEALRAEHKQREERRAHRVAEREGWAAEEEGWAEQDRKWWAAEGLRSVERAEERARIRKKLEEAEQARDAGLREDAELVARARAQGLGAQGQNAAPTPTEAVRPSVHVEVPAPSAEQADEEVGPAPDAGAAGLRGRA